MKKLWIVSLLALSLTSCDLSSLVSHRVSYSEETGEKSGITIVIEGSDNLLLKNHERTEYANRFTITSIQAGSTTIKRLDGKITFYKPPIYGKPQLDEITNSEEHPEYYFFEQQIDFSNAKDTNFDFIYLTDFSMQCADSNNKIFKNLRVALFNKETGDDYYVFSYDKNGTVSKTAYELDVNADGKIDQTQGYDWEEDKGPIIYTTGIDSYTTDTYENVILSESEIAQDSIPKLKSLIPFSKNIPLTIRIWAEGWELDNNDFVLYNDETVNIDLKLEGYQAK